MALTHSQKKKLNARLIPLIVIELRKLREMGDTTPRATLKSRYDSASGTTDSGKAHLALLSVLNITEGGFTPSEFNEMVDAAASQL